MNESISKYKIKVKKQKKNICGTCGKSFIRKKSYQDHIIACEISHMSQYKEECKGEEDESMFSPMEQNRIILYLARKVKNLEHKVDALTKYVERKKKKINIIDHLNDKYSDVKLYDFWLKNLTFDTNQLNYTFKHGLIDGIYSFLEINLPIDDNVSHPIKCFDQKHGKFYCMAEKGWIMMDNKDIINCLRNVRSKLIMRFLAWKEEHKELYDKDYRFQDKCNEYQFLVLGGKMEEEVWIKRIKNKLYNYLKCDLKEIVECEFVF